MRTGEGSGEELARWRLARGREKFGMVNSGLVESKGALPPVLRCWKSVGQLMDSSPFEVWRSLKVRKGRSSSCAFRSDFTFWRACFETKRWPASLPALVAECSVSCETDAIDFGLRSYRGRPSALGSQES